MPDSHHPPLPHASGGHPPTPCRPANASLCEANAHHLAAIGSSMHEQAEGPDATAVFCLLLGLRIAATLPSPLVLLLKSRNWKMRLTSPVLLLYRLAEACSPPLRVHAVPLLRHTWVPE